MPGSTLVTILTGAGRTRRRQEVCAGSAESPARMLTAAASSGPSLVTVYYVTAIIGAFGAIIGGAYGAIRFYGRKKAEWQDDGKQRAEHNRLLSDNTAAAKANTVAIGDLSGKFGDFATAVRTELNGHETRISRLETQQPRRRGDNHGAPQ